MVLLLFDTTERKHDSADSQTGHPDWDFLPARYRHPDSSNRYELAKARRKQKEEYWDITKVGERSDVHDTWCNLFSHNIILRPMINTYTAGAA